MSQPTILVIIGITGDLSRRKLLPAIEQLARAAVLPAELKIVGVTRRAVSKEDVLRGADLGYVSDHLHMVQMNISSEDSYKELASTLNGFDKDFSKPAQRLFYLSIPPQMSPPVVELLGKSGLASRENTKILLEKPFGVDKASAEELVAHTQTYFTEDQIYRIDHYLAKEMAQNFIVFRTDNSLFKRTWNRDFIEKIDIITSENIGIEGRAAFYEQTGALRDVVQSHLLQLAALTLMTPPVGRDLSKVPELRLEALRQLYIPNQENVKRAQYETYRSEVNNQHSLVETYASITLASRDPHWEGVPIRLATGKALNRKETSICITYKKDEAHEANELILTLQPNEGVTVKLWTKTPGYEWKVEECALKFEFKDHFPLLPEAYERVFLDAIQSNHLLFTGSDEVLESWRILEPVQEAWELSREISTYPVGSDISAL